MTVDINFKIVVHENNVIDCLTYLMLTLSEKYNLSIEMNSTDFFPIYMHFQYQFCFWPILSIPVHFRVLFLSYHQHQNKIIIMIDIHFWANKKYFNLAYSFVRDLRGKLQILILDNTV